MDANARLAAADAILDRGVRFKIPHAPVRIRLLGLDRITIKSLRAGTILEISRVIDSNQIEDAIMLKDHAFLVRCLEPMAQCIALAMINDKLLIRRFTKLVKKMVLRLPPDMIVEIFLHIERLNQKKLFLTITRFFLIQAQMMTSPRKVNPGQE